MAASHQPDAAAAPAADAPSRLEAMHLEKSYGTRKVVKDVSMVVQKGEVVGLLGPNGAGKTTSFYMIVGLVRSDGGDIRIDGIGGEHADPPALPPGPVVPAARRPRSSASSPWRRTCAPCWSCSAAVRGGLTVPCQAVAMLPTMVAPTSTRAMEPSGVSNRQTTRSLRANNPGTPRAVSGFTENREPGT